MKKTHSLREMGLDELRERENDIRGELIIARGENATGKSSPQVRNLRKALARTLTIIKEKENDSPNAKKIREQL